MSTKFPLQASLVCSECRHHHAEVGALEQAALVAQTSRVAIRCSFGLFPSAKALHACEPLDRELVELGFAQRHAQNECGRDRQHVRRIAGHGCVGLGCRAGSRKPAFEAATGPRCPHRRTVTASSTSRRSIVGHGERVPLVRQQLVEQEQEDNAADAALEWTAARSSVARLLRSSWYNKASEKERQELPKEAVEVNSTLLTSFAREPEASQQCKPEPPGETVSHTQEETNPPLEVSPPQEQENPQTCKPQPKPPAIRRTWKCVWRQGMDVRSWPQTARQNIVGCLSCGEIFEVAEERRFRDGSEGVFLRLANKQGWVFSKTRSGTFCIQVDDSCRQYSNYPNTTASHDAWTWDSGTADHQRDRTSAWQQWSEYSSDSSTYLRLRWPADAKSWDSWALFARVPGRAQDSQGLALRY